MKKNKTILFLLLGIFIISFSSAVIPTTTFDYRMIKWTMCDSFNLTGYECDIWWEADSNPYYIDVTTNDDVFNKTQVQDMLDDLNQTLTDNLVVNIDDENIYNISQVDSLVSSLKKDWLINQTGEYITEDDLEDLLDDLEDDSGDSNTMFMILIGALILIVAFFMFTNNKKNTNEYSEGYGNIRPQQPRILSRNNAPQQPVAQAPIPQPVAQAPIPQAPILQQPTLNLGDETPQ